MKKTIKNLVQSALKKIDLELVHSSQNQLADLTNKKIPLHAIQYFAGIKPAIINIDLAAGCTNRWYDLKPGSMDPRIFAIRKSLEQGLVGEELYKSILNILESHKKISKCWNAAEKLGLDSIDSIESKKLMNYPAWAAVLPWDNWSIEEKFKKFPLAVKLNRADNGLQIRTNDPDEIMRIDEKHSLPSHARQYAMLTELIKNNGLRYGNKYRYITAEVFIDGAEARWKLGGEGNHRGKVAAALGLKNIPVIVTNVIKIDELRLWPNVINKTFSEKDAKFIFSCIFNARPPSFERLWIESKGTLYESQGQNTPLKVS